MYYKKCPYCGANNDPGEKCSCQETTPAERSIYAAAYNETYKKEYEGTYMQLNNDQVPACIANHAAEIAAKKKAKAIAGEISKNYRHVRREA